MQKIQTIVDQIKSFDFYNLDEATEKSIGSDSGVESMDPVVDLLKRNVAKRESRNIFDGSSYKRLQGSLSERKQKRKSNDLFRNFDVAKTDSQYKPPVNQQQMEEEKENNEQESQIVQPTESERLLTDLNTFEARLSPEQQVDISNFLDHIKDKPKAFSFDTSPYLLTQLEKLNRPSVENQENSNDEEILEGAKKFFEFDSAPVKRSLYNNAQDFQKIAKLKSKLIAEYREHHPVIDYSALLRKIDSDKHHPVEKNEDFMENFYQPNDGSSGLYDMIKPYHPDKRVMSPFELDLNFQLDNQFKDLDMLDTSHDKQKDDPIIPLYKPEIQLEDEYLSPP